MDKRTFRDIVHAKDQQTKRKRRTVAYHGVVFLKYTC